MSSNPVRGDTVGTLDVLDSEGIALPSYLAAFVIV